MDKHLFSPGVTLTFTEGPLAGKCVHFHDRTLCTIGRSRECYLQLPNDTANITVSRHHCMLDIDPPEVRIRDLGSLNGTFLNGTLIGQRDRQKPVTEDETEIILQDGDEIRVGSTAFRIGLAVPEITKEWDHAENDTFDPAACI